jgi:hypothetical protein
LAKREKKRVTSYKPTGAEFKHTKLPMRVYWDALEPSVYLTLFSWLAPIKDGRQILQRFPANAKPKFAHPSYLGYVVLTPVLKIVTHLMDISNVTKVLTKEDERKVMKTNKYRHLLTYYVTSRYLMALVKCSEQDLTKREDKELSGKDIGEMVGVTQMLLNLPKEYQRWNKHYNKKEYNIRPGGNKARKPEVTETIQNNTPTTATNNNNKPMFPRPFDVCCKIDTSFQQCVKNKTKVNEENLQTLTLGESWDPYKISLRLLNGEYDILVEDMWNKPIEIYKLLEPKVLAGLGKSGRRIDETGLNDDNQTAKKPKIEETNGGMKQMEADLDAEAIKQIIINNAQTLDVEQQTEAKAMACWNQLARELTVRLTDNKHQGLTIEEEEVKAKATEL